MAASLSGMEIFEMGFSSHLTALLIPVLNIFYHSTFTDFYVSPYQVAAILLPLFQILVLVKNLIHRRWEITIQSPDPLCTELKEYLRTAEWVGQPHALTARSVDNEVVGEKTHSCNSVVSGRRDKKHVNYALQAKRTVEYLPTAPHIFVSGTGHRLLVQWKEEHVQLPYRLPYIRQAFTISSYEGSKPLKDFFQEVITARLERNAEKIAIYAVESPSPGCYEWVAQKYRTVRRIETVILDKEIKESVLDEINNYLLDETADWYHKRGIPWRRGYVFAGPPGTGKTSFSSAIAGDLGLPIYLLSLDRNMADHHLSRLMEKLPDRCIVLIEDIGNSGFQCSQEPTDSHGAKLSLSGVLSALDGVGSNEGHVVIITTDKPGALHEAVVRPGRIDRIVEFTKATKGQVTEFLKLIYEAKATEDLCKNFERIVPGGLMSQAKVQQFLQDHRDDPQKALEDAPKWVEEAEREARNPTEEAGRESQNAIDDAKREARNAVEDAKREARNAIEDAKRDGTRLMMHRETERD